MIFIGRAFRENEQFDYPKETITKGREKIKEFPTLSSILENFNKADRQNYNKNHFLMLARDAVSNPFIGGQPDKEAEAKLKRYDILLNFLIPRLSKDTKEKIISRLKDFGENHFKTILELELLLELIVNKSVSDIHYEDPKKGNHDFCIVMGDTEINIELTSLGEGTIQRILENAFDMASNEIIEYISESTLLKLDVDTDLILNLKGKNDSDSIKDVLVGGFVKIKPLVNVVRNNHCILESNFGDQEKYLYDFKDLFKYYNEFGERLVKLLETPEGIEFLKSTKVKDISEIPYSSFIIGDARTKLVEIHSHSFWPSKSENLRKESILRQFKNRIIEKIKGGQLKGKVNSIIAVNFSDVIFHDYSSNTDIFGQENFDELKSIVEDVFIQEKDNEIFGVLLYEGTLKKSRFVRNPRINIPEEALSKINLLMEIQS
ncbi:hypothetical protein HYW20_02735 [Candidatus Woesearchaeota archaeon]|nr:hypothetical protein [Candidatus Woesearchaeota archaeon]